MKIKQLHELISGAVKDNQLIITPDLLNSPDFTSVASQYQLTNIRIVAPQVGSVNGQHDFLVKGETHISLEQGEMEGLEPGSSALRFFIVDGQPQLSLTYQLSPDWKLGGTFTLLDQSFTDLLPIVFSNLQFSTQLVDHHVGVESPPGFSLGGTLSLEAAIFEDFKLLFPGVSEIPIAANIAEIHPETQIELLSSAFSDVKILDVEFRQPRLQIKAIQAPPPEQVSARKMLALALKDPGRFGYTKNDLLRFKAYLDERGEVVSEGGQPDVLLDQRITITPPTIRLLTLLDIGLRDNFIEVAGSYPILSSNMAIEGITPVPHYPLIRGLSELERLFGSTDLTGALPDSLKHIGDNIRLVSLGLNFDIKSPTTLLAAETTLRITRPFHLFPDLEIVNVESLDFNWKVFNPFNGELRSINFYASAEVQLGGAYQVNLQIGKDSAGYYLTVSSVDGQELHLSLLLRQFNLPENLLPELLVTGFEFEAMIGQKDYSLGVFFGDEWNVGGSGIILSDVYVRGSYAESGNPNFAAYGIGVFHLPDSEISFLVEGEKGEGWSLSGNLQGDSVTMAELISALQKAFGIEASLFPEFFHNIEISDLALSLSTEPQSFNFDLYGSMALLDTPVGFNLQMLLTKADSSWTIVFSGCLYFSGEAFELEFNHDQEGNSFTASWTSTDGRQLSIQDILDGLGLERIELPDGINVSLGLKSVTFSYNSDPKQITIHVTTIEDHQAWFGTHKTDGAYRYYFAVAYDGEFRLSQISEHLTIFEGIKLDQPFVVIANFTDRQFTLPDTPFKGVVNGIAIRAILTMETTSHESPLGEAVDYLSHVFGDEEIHAGIDLGVYPQDFALIGSTESHFQFPSESFNLFTIEGVSLRIRINPVEIEFSSHFLFNFELLADPPVSPLPLDGKFSLVKQGVNTQISASLFTDTRIVHPFMIPVVTLDSFGFGVSGTLGPQSNVRFTVESDGELGLDSSDKKIPQKLNATVKNRNGKAYLPYFESHTQGPIDFKQLLEAFLPGIPVAAPLALISLRELYFYFCAEPQTLPSGVKLEKGASFLAASSIWGFDSYLHLQIDSEKHEIKGDLETDPLTIKNPNDSGQNLASITGSGQGNKNYGIEPGGPLVHFITSPNDGALSASVIADVMGVTQVVEASFFNDGLQVVLEQSIPGIQGQLSVLFRNRQNMAFSCEFGLSIQCAPEIEPFGTIHIDSEVGEALSISFDNGTFRAMVNGSFSWMGHHIQLIDVDVSQWLFKLKDLRGALIEYILENADRLFANILSDVKNYIAAVINLGITGGEFIVNVLHGHYGINDVDDLLTDMAELLSAGIALNGKLNFALLKVLPGIPSVPFHADTGINFFGLRVGAGFNSPPVPLDLLNKSAGQHLDLATDSITVENSVPIEGFQHHFGVNILGVQIGGVLNLSGDVGVHAAVTLNDFRARPSAHIDAQMSGSFHARAGSGDCLHLDESLNIVDIPLNKTI